MINHIGLNEQSREMNIQHQDMSFGIQPLIDVGNVGGGEAARQENIANPNNKKVVEAEMVYSRPTTPQKPPPNFGQFQQKQVLKENHQQLQQ